MLKLIEILATPLLIGVSHSAEADHVLAVGTLVNNNKANKWYAEALKGMVWGAGHTAAILLAGILFILLNNQLDFSSASVFEWCVGLVLTVIGLVKLTQSTVRKHKHESDNRKLWFFLIGILHGLAGSGSIAVLLAQFQTSLANQLYFLLAFGLGTIIGMFAIAGLISKFSILNHKILYAINIVVAVSSVVYGIVIMYQNYI